MSENNEKVGYKNPPKSTQYKPGQSGNPKGRPKGCKIIKPESVGAALKFEMEDEMLARENGKKRKVSKLQAWIRKLYIDSMNGDKVSTRILKDLMLKYPMEKFKGMKVLHEEKKWKPDMSADEAKRLYDDVMKQCRDEI